MLTAFHGKPALKDKYLKRLSLHEKADEIIHGVYWQDGKGCAVGCTIHSSSHMKYEQELGIPVVLARLEDRLFEGQHNGDAKTFPRRFLEAAQPGADLSRVGAQFLHWLLTDELVGRDDPRVAKQVNTCADVLVPLNNGKPADQAAARKASREARDAPAAYAAPDAVACAYKRMAVKLLELMAAAPVVKALRSRNSAA